MIGIRSIRVRDTPVGALVDCRRHGRRSQGFGPSFRHGPRWSSSLPFWGSCSLTPQRRAAWLPRESRRTAVRWLLENCRASTSIFSKRPSGRFN